MKALVKSALATSFGWRASALLRRRAAVVLMYHRICREPEPFPGLDVEQFRSHMLWIKRHCRPIGPDELRDEVVHGGRWRPPVLVTFDDGYRDYRDLAYPVLQELGIPALVFLTTGFIDEPDRLFWWDRIHLGVHRARTTRVRLPWGDRRQIELSDAAARRGLMRAAKNDLRRVPERERDERVAALLRELGDPSLETERQMLSWDEVRATSRLTTWGGHTHTHPILSLLDAAQLEREVRLCRERIEAETGSAPRYFAYPNGRVQDFTAETRQAVQRHGFDVAFSTEEGVNGPEPDWMAVKRIPGLGPTRELAWLISGVRYGGLAGLRRVPAGARLVSGISTG